MAEARVLEQRRLIVADGPRKGRTDRLVFYQVDAGPVRVVRLADEGLTESLILDAIRKDQADLSALSGRVFKL